MAECIIKNLTVIDINTKKETIEWIRHNISYPLDKSLNPNYIPLPVLIRSNFHSFFDIIFNEIEKDTNDTKEGPKILGDYSKLSKEEIDQKRKEVKCNIECTYKTTEKNLNFLLNSSIWVRFCDNGDWDGKSEDSKTDDIADALEEFDWFEHMKLYEFKPAKEYIEYQLRAQSQNYLAEIGGHGVHITPMIYSNEVEFRNFFLKKDNKIHFKYLGKEDVGNRFLTKDVAFRILLVDDKIWGGNNDSSDNEIKISRCENCETCKKAVNADYCKLKIIHSLLSGKFILSSQKKQVFQEQTYWIDNVDSVVVEKVGISQIWEKRADTEQLEQREDIVSMLSNDLKPLDGQITNYVQIVGVRDLETALSLMSCCKFDIILLDYLLDKRSDDNPERTYSTELFEFLSYDFKSETDSSIVEMMRKSSGFDDDLLRAFQDNVKLNRGPLDKYWIVPMTSYNSSFISDLQSKHVRLIDHRWNISQGADPINTPWKFLHKINEFIDLQLRSCVFHMEQLLFFLKYSCEDTIELHKKKNGKLTFFDFQSFMGAEYANFMRRYGNRHLIQRDALWDKTVKNMENKSVFSSYIWKEYYEKPVYRDTIELNRLIQRFLRHAAIMRNDGNGQQRLEETYGQLTFFIDIDSNVKKTIDNNTELNDLSAQMMKLREIIDCLPRS